MRITQHSDYALRVLIYAGGNSTRLVTIAEIAARFAVSRTHLMKVVNQLVRAGFLTGQRGKGGGLRLARRPEEIRVGDVLRATESDLRLVECFGRPGACLLDPDCRLKHALGEALDAFLAVLDRYTLADLVASPTTRRLVAQLIPVPLAAESLQSPLDAFPDSPEPGTGSSALPLHGKGPFRNPSSAPGT